MILRKKYNKNNILFFLVLLVQAFLFFKYYGKFGDLLIDTGREATVPWRILEGQVLYKDVHYEYGPFVPYFFALLYKIFGVHFNVLQYAGLAVSLLVSFFIFKITSLYTRKIYPLVASLLFVLVFVFHFTGINIFNFIVPYSYAATFGVLFQLILFFIGYHLLKYGDFSAYLLFGIFYTLCLLTKVEVIFSSTVFVTFLFSSLIVYEWKAGRLFPLFTCERLKKSALCGVPVIFTLFSVTLYFSAQMDFVGYLKNEILFLIGENTTTPLAKLTIGTSDIQPYLTKAAISLFCYALLVVLFLLLDKWVAGKPGSPQALPREKRKRTMVLLIVPLTFLLAYALGYDLFFNSLNLILVLFSFLLFGIVVKKIKKRGALKKNLFLLSMTVSSLALTARIIFNNSIERYGFYLLVPSIVPLFVFLFHYLPVIVRKKFNTRPFCHNLGFSVLFLSIGCLALSGDMQKYQFKSEKLVTDRGAIYLYPRQFPVVNGLLTKLKSYDRSNYSVLVIPEGILLNYFLNSVPTQYFSAVTPDLVSTPERENAFIREVERKDFKYLFVTPRYTFEWDLPVMGTDYLKRGALYLRNNFEPLFLFGPTPFKKMDEFGIAVLINKKYKKLMHSRVDLPPNHT